MPHQAHSSTHGITDIFVFCLVVGGRGVHRRRINAEEKAKVVAAFWVTEFIKVLAALAVLH